MKITPLFDRVLLKPVEQTNTLESGLILASSQVKLPRAAVVSLGSGLTITETGTKIADFEVKIGDTVIFEEHTANKITLGKENFYLIKQTDILGILETEQ